VVSSICALICSPVAHYSHETCEREPGASRIVVGHAKHRLGQPVPERFIVLGPQPNSEAIAPRESEPPMVEARGKPRKNFDFYSVLPEMEVVIPDAEISAKARAEAAQPAAAGATPAASANARYLVQTGSYPTAKAADEVKAELAILGFVAQITPVTINGKSWNRVRLDPYATTI